MLVDGVLNEEPGSPEFVDCARGLAEAAFSKDRSMAGQATRAIFAEIVEPWSDSFDPELVDAYVSFMSEVVYAPRSPIAGKLTKLGYPGPADLRERYQRIRNGARDRAFQGDYGRVKLVMILSRVTLGADIAVTSIFLRAAVSAFRGADFEFIAPRKNAYLLADGDVVERRLLSYSRSALLANRLRAWLRVRSLIEKRTAGLEPGEWFVIDPDSRLTQLGLLPVTDDRHYDFFESRSVAPDEPTSLGELAGRKCEMNFVDVGDLMPNAWIRPTELARGESLRSKHLNLIAAVSFGVGGRETKRLGDEFEDALLELLRSLGFQILLDYGAGEDEAQVVERRIASFRGSKAHMRTISDARRNLADLMTVRGSLATFGGWLHAVDVFVGYDSASAHLAAALDVPVVEVFAGAPSRRFMQRWTPFGRQDVRVIPADGSDVLDGVRRELVAVKEQGAKWGYLRELLGL